MSLDELNDFTSTYWNKFTNKEQGDLVEYSIYFATAKEGVGRRMIEEYEEYVKDLIKRYK